MHPKASYSCKKKGGNPTHNVGVWKVPKASLSSLTSHTGDQQQLAMPLIAALYCVVKQIHTLGTAPLPVVASSRIRLLQHPVSRKLIALFFS